MKNNYLIHNNATAQARNFLHKWIFGIWTFIIFSDPFTQLASLPDEVFVATGLFSLPFKYGFLSWNVLALMKILLIVVCICAFLNIRFVISSLVACVLLSAHQGLIRGFGHINHAEIVLLISTYIICFSAIADKIYLKKAREPLSFNMHAVPFIGIVMVLSLTYAFTGIFRVVYYGIEPFTTDTILNHFLVNSQISDTWPFHMHKIILENYWASLFLKISFPLLTVFEILAPLVLVSNKFRYAFILVMAPFHILSWLFLGIFFWESLVLFIVFFDFSYKERILPF